MGKGLALIIYGVNIISILSMVFMRRNRKDMSVTFAWIMVLMFLPLIGFILYFFFGSTSKLKLAAKRNRMNDIEEEYGTLVRRNRDGIQGQEIRFQDPITEQYRDMILMNTRLSNCFYTADNNAELLIDGQQKFARMFADIRRAEKTINVLYFIFKSKDEIGAQMITLLTEKARQGVDVKLVYDGMGCLKTKMEDFQGLIDAGGQVQTFLPSKLKTLLQVNYRLHRKVVIIDGRVAYTGGINVGDDYLGKYEKITPWRDTSVRLTGSCVIEHQLRFLEDWIFLEKQNKAILNPIFRQPKSEVQSKYFVIPREKGNMGVQIISAGPDDLYATHRDSYVKIINSAKKYVYIQSPYFVPDATLLDSIRMCAESGVDIRLMLPGIPDKAYVYHVAMSYVEELLEAGVKIYIHKGFLHAKTFVADDHVSSIGTTNLDLRSFYLDYEVNNVIYSTTFAKQCKAQYFKDIEDSKEVILNEFIERGIWKKFCESICRFIIPLA